MCRYVECCNNGRSTADSELTTSHGASTIRSVAPIESASKRRSIGWIVAGTAVVLLAGVIGLALFFFSRYVETEDADGAAAAREFQAVRARLAGQLPLLELRGTLPPIFHRDRTAPGSITTLRGLVYSVEDEEIHRLTVPISI